MSWLVPCLDTRVLANVSVSEEMSWLHHWIPNRPSGIWCSDNGVVRQLPLWKMYFRRRNQQRAINEFYRFQINNTSRNLGTLLDHGVGQSAFCETLTLESRPCDGLSDPRKLGEIYRHLTVQVSVTSERAGVSRVTGLRPTNTRGNYLHAATIYRNIAHGRTIRRS